jgi:membrane associated rhomboid family serine protease
MGIFIYPLQRLFLQRSLGIRLKVLYFADTFGLASGWMYTWIGKRRMNRRKKKINC